MEFDLMSGFSNSDLMEKAPASSQKFEKDKRFWELTKDGNSGSAIIRLLPDKNKIPYVRIYHYASKKEVNGKTHWLIANSPSSIGLPCPIQEHYFDLLNAGDEKLAKGMYNRKVKYYTNIMVIKDPAHPENEGKVFLFSFGTKLLEKFKGWIEPDESQKALGETPKEIFHPINGHNIKLQIKKSSEFWNYDSTSVDPSPCRIGEPTKKLSNEEIIKVLTEQTYDLSEFQKPEYFESYDKLKERLEKFDKPFGAKKDTAVPTVTEKAQPKPKPAEVVTSEPADSSDDDWLDQIG